MNKKIGILSILLLIQLGLYAFLQTSSNPMAVFKKTENLMKLDLTQVDNLLIEDNDKEPLKLVKEKNSWVLPNKDSFPASQEKVEKLLDKLKNFKKSWPVGQTMVAAKQFSVVDEKYEKRISFFNSTDKKGTLYIGSSPSFKKVHTRVNDDKFTYTINFNNYDVSLDVNDWLDKDYNKVEKSKIKEITFEQTTLTNENGSFINKNLNESFETDTSKTKTIASLAANPTFEEVLGKETKIIEGKNEAFAYTIKKQNDDKIVFTFYETFVPILEETKDPNPQNKENDDFYTLKVSNNPFYFKVRKSQVQKIHNVKSEDTSKKKLLNNSGSSIPAKSEKASDLAIAPDKKG